MRLCSVVLTSALIFSSSLVAAAPAPQFGSILGDITSVAGAVTSVVGDVPSVAEGIFETVTSFAGSIVTIVTSEGGKAVTVAASDASVAAADVTSFFEAHATTTSLPQTTSNGKIANAASRMGAVGGLLTPMFISVLVGMTSGVWAIL